MICHARENAFPLEFLFSFYIKYISAYDLFKSMYHPDTAMIHLEKQICQNYKQRIVHLKISSNYNDFTPAFLLLLQITLNFSSFLINMWPSHFCTLCYQSAPLPLMAHCSNAAFTNPSDSHFNCPSLLLSISDIFIMDMAFAIQEVLNLLSPLRAILMKEDLGSVIWNKLMANMLLHLWALIQTIDSHVGTCTLDRLALISNRFISPLSMCKM